MKSQVRVINVGHGDCLILNPDPDMCDRGNSCKYQGFDIFVDVGDGQVDVSVYHDTNNKLILLLSHAHKDHIGGLSHFFAKSFYSKRINELWLPFYYDEIVYITNKILSFKGISNVSYDHYAYLALKDVVATHSLLRHVSRELGLTVRGLAENFSLCSHIKIYNPPTNINKLLKIPQFNSESEIDLFIENIRTRLRTWFEDSDADELEKIFDYYARVQNNRISHNLDSAYDEYMDHNVSYPMLIRNDDLDYSNNISFSRAQYIVGVFHILRPYLDDFIREPNALRLKVIYNKLKSTSHNVSIVFQCQGRI